MNPRHRDRVAFVRVCSGRLAKDMLVVNTRLDTELRLSRVYRFFGRDRETVPEAFPGDVVGIVNPGRIAIGDTLYAGTARGVSADPAVSVGAVRDPAAGRQCGTSASTRRSRSSRKKGCCRSSCRRPGTRNPIVGVIGSLQLDVIEARMRSEYGIPCTVDRLPHVAARWPVMKTAEPLVLPTSGVREATGPTPPRGARLRVRLGAALHHREEPERRVPRVDVSLTRRPAWGTT